MQSSDQSQGEDRGIQKRTINVHRPHPRTEAGPIMLQGEGISLDDLELKGHTLTVTLELYGQSEVRELPFKFTHTIHSNK